MSMSAVIKKNMTLGGKQFFESKMITGDGAIVEELSVPAAETGNLTTRGGNTSGTITLDDYPVNPLLIQGARIDIYWTGGCRRGATADTLSGYEIAFTGGAGDNLPTQSTDVIVSVPELLDTIFDGTNVTAILFATPVHGQFILEDSGGEELANEINAGATFDWHNDSGVDNPITGDSITKCYVSHDSLAAQTMKVGILFNN